MIRCTVARPMPAVPSEILLLVQALKNAEQFIGITGIEPHPVVADEDGGDAFDFAGADLDDGGRANAREFDGVGEEVNENQFEQAGVALALGERFDAPFDPGGPRFLPSNSAMASPNVDVVELGDLLIHGAAADAGEA